MAPQSSSSLFVSIEAKEKLIAGFNEFRSLIPYKTEIQKIDTQFGETQVLTGGREGLPKLVLLHSMMTTSAHLLYEMHPLLERFQVYAIDIIGQSVMSQDRSMSVKNTDYSIWLNEVVTQLGLDSFYLLGVSMGGFIATQYASFHPKKIKKLSLLVPAGFVNGPIFEGLIKFGWPLLKYKMNPTKKNFDLFLKYLLTTKEEHWVRYMEYVFTGYKLKLAIPPLFSKEALSEIKLPVQVLAADNDLSFPGKRLLSRAKEVFPSLQDSFLIENCYHCPPTNNAFKGWLSGRIATFFLSSKEKH